MKLRSFYFSFEMEYFLAEKKKCPYAWWIKNVAKSHIPSQ